MPSTGLMVKANRVDVGGEARLENDSIVTIVGFVSLLQMEAGE